MPKSLTIQMPEMASGVRPATEDAHCPVRHSPAASLFFFFLVLPVLPSCQADMRPYMRIRNTHSSHAPLHSPSYTSSCICIPCLLRARAALCLSVSLSPSLSPSLPLSLSPSLPLSLSSPPPPPSYVCGGYISLNLCKSTYIHTHSLFRTSCQRQTGRHKKQFLKSPFIW
jgi:hypothetical protein